MRSSIAARGTITAALLATAALFFLVFGTSAATAAETVSGTATFSVGNGPAANALKKGKAKTTAVAPAKNKKAGKRTQVLAQVKTLKIGSSSSASLNGGIRFSAGKRKATISGLNLSISSNKTVVKGKIGGKQLTVLNAAGVATTDTDAGTVRIMSAKLSLTPAAAGKLRKSLKLKKLPASEIGTFSFFGSVTKDTPVDPCVANPGAEGCQPAPTVDPYLAECNVAATSEVAGSLPAATPLPTLTGSVATSAPTKLTWGFKSSFRSYIVYGAGGSFHGLGGATVNTAVPVATGFDFPVTTGQYTTNATNTLTDDQAVINGSGKAVFCATAHKFRVVISNPTVVIDGANSRIVADVDTNLTGVWSPDQRIDLAKLDLSGVTPTDTVPGQGTTWSNVPAELTAAGAAAICGSGEQAACDYSEGTAIDPITVAASKPVEADPYIAQCGVPATSKVSTKRPAAAALPTLTDPLATTSPASIDWGFKVGFRGYIYGTNSATAPNSVFTALDGASRVPGGDPTRGFSYPTTASQYSAGDPLDTSDDKAVINGSGAAVYCNREHGFWASIANPTIVIDGDDSRIVADVASNESGKWSPTERTDLADLNLTGITPIYNKSGSEVSWGNIPATLSASAAPFATYIVGTALDSINVAIKTPYVTTDMATLANYVSTELPFPNTSATTGGCSLPVPAGGTAAAARTVDENGSFGGTANVWTTDGARPAALPSLSAGTAVTGGGLDWGLRSGLRSTANAGGRFNLSGGATASTDYFGNGGGFASPPGTYGTGLGAASAFFTWPAATTAGTYDAGTAATDDDRLILRTAGTVGLCNDATTPGLMLYGTVLSNPTVIIDGASSRITVDVATRYRLSWVRATVDIASFDATGISPTGTTTKTWTFDTTGAVKLTASGESVLRMLGTAYISGATLDAVTVRAQV